MTAFLVFPQSISVQIKSNNPEAAALLVTEQAADVAEARMFEFCMSREALQRLKDDITIEYRKDGFPNNGRPSGQHSRTNP
jgi:hypothetical protein